MIKQMNRREYIGGGDIADIIKGNYKAVARNKIESKDISHIPAIGYGLEMEGSIIDSVENKLNLKFNRQYEVINQVDMMTHSYKLAGHLDGYNLTNDTMNILEVKTTSTKHMDDMYEKALTQARFYARLCYMDCFKNGLMEKINKINLIIAIFNKDNHELSIKIETIYDPFECVSWFIDNCEKHCNKFWSFYQNELQNQELKELNVDEYIPDEITKLSKTYTELLKQVEAYKEVETKLKEATLKYMQDNDIWDMTIDDNKITRVKSSVRKSVDTKAMKDKNMDILYKEINVKESIRIMA